MGIERAIGSAKSSMGSLTAILKELNTRAILAADTIKAFDPILKSITGITTDYTKIVGRTVGEISDLVEAYSLADTKLKDIAPAIAGLGEAWNILTKEEKTEYYNLRALSGRLAGLKVAIEGALPGLAEQAKAMAKAREKAFSLLGAMFGLNWLSKEISGRFFKWAKASDVVSYFLEDLDYALTDIADVMFDALGPALEVIVGAFELLADWIDEQPDMVKLFLLGLLAVIPVLLLGMSLLTQFAVAILALEAVGGIAGLFGILKDSIVGVAEAFYEGAVSIGKFFWANLIKLKTYILEQFIPTLTAKLAPAVAFLKGHFASLAIGVAALIGTFMIVDQLLSALPAQLRGPVAAITALIAGIVAATVAWLAFHGTMTVGVAIPIILAAVGAGIAGLKAMIPSFEGLKGGIEFAKPSTISVHEGERLYGAGGRKPYEPKEPPPTIIIDTTGSSLDEIVHNAVRKTWDEASEYYSRQYRRSEY